jgi:hypothetical protein
MAFEKCLEYQRGKKKTNKKVQFQQDSFVSLSFPQAICASTNFDARRINKPNELCVRFLGAGEINQITVKLKFFPNSSVIEKLSS